jgi:hypothetical protein
MAEGWGEITTGVCADIRASPHSAQNLSSGGLLKPHLGQTAINFVPHSRQNFLVSGFSAWHFGHFIESASYQILL